MDDEEIISRIESETVQLIYEKEYEEKNHNRIDTCE